MPTLDNMPEAIRFGGEWTLRKLEILRRYLDFYTTALKHQPFKLIYIDAFAGTGGIGLGHTPSNPDLGELRELIQGSAQIAVRISEKSFDELVFIEADIERVKSLEDLKQRHAQRNITILNDDANKILCRLQRDWRSTRGVLFLDPFGLSIEWSTIEHIGSLEALDTWILFPVGTVARMLPRRRVPEEIEPAWAERLTRVYGDLSWRDLYSVSPQVDLFVDRGYERAPGVEGLLRIYKDRLSNLFGKRYLESSVRLRNSLSAPLYEFIFCAGNSAGAKLAKKVAAHIIRGM